MAEMDIFTDTTADDTTADNNVVYDAGMFTITNPLQGADYSEAEAYYYSDTYVGEDGFRYNADGERVYRYKEAVEGGSGKYRGDFGKNDESEIYGDAGFYTEAQIRKLWEAGGMGNTTDQFDNFDQYMAYIKEVDTLQSNPEIRAALDRREQIAREGLKQGLRPDQVQSQIDEEIGDTLNSWQTQWQGIRENYGVDDIIRTDNGDVYKWNGYAYTKTYEVNTAKAETMALLAVAGGALLGPALGAAATAGSTAASSIATALGVPLSTVTAAVGGVAGSAITQTLLTGEINPGKLFTAGLTAGIIDLAGTFGAGQFSDVSAEAFNAATSGPMVAMNEKIWDLANTLQVDFDTALKIVKGVAVGTINGKDLDGILTNAATTLGSEYVAEYIADTYGNAVPNLFREGTTEIDEDAIKEVSRVFLRDALNGEIDQGTLLSMGLGYIREDGTFAWADPRWNPENTDFWEGFKGILPDIDITGGEGWDVRFLTDEEKEANQVLAGYIDEANQDNIFPGDQDQANIILQYDQETIDRINQYLEEVKQAGRDFDDEVLQPVKDIIVEAGYAIDENVLQPIKDGAKWLWDQLPSLPEGPEGPKFNGPDLPSIDLPKIGFDLNIGKPFGTDLKEFTPIRSPQLAPQVQVAPKVQTQGYDPKRAGSGIVASLFSEYIG